MSIISSYAAFRIAALSFFANFDPIARKLFPDEKRLGDALLDLANTPVQLQVKGMTGKIKFSETGKLRNMNSAPLNFDYIKNLSLVINRAERLGFSPPIAGIYPEAFKRLKSGQLDGIEHPIIFSEIIIDEIHHAFFEQNNKLSRLFNRLIDASCDFQLPEQRMANIAGEYHLDKILTDLAKEDERHIVPEIDVENWSTKALILDFRLN